MQDDVMTWFGCLSGIALVKPAVESVSLLGRWLFAALTWIAAHEVSESERRWSRSIGAVLLSASLAMQYGPYLRHQQEREGQRTIEGVLSPGVEVVGVIPGHPDQEDRRLETDDQALDRAEHW